MNIVNHAGGGVEITGLVLHGDHPVLLDWVKRHKGNEELGLHLKNYIFCSLSTHSVFLHEKLFDVPWEKSFCCHVCV